MAQALAGELLENLFDLELKKALAYRASNYIECGFEQVGISKITEIPNS